MNFTIGTPGAAIAISSAALFFSIFLPISLERRRERREKAKTVGESWRRINVATTKVHGHLDSDIELVEVISRWADDVALEVTSPDGCLWRNKSAFDSLRMLQSGLAEVTLIPKSSSDHDAALARLVATWKATLATINKVTCDQIKKAGLG